MNTLPEHSNRWSTARESAALFLLVLAVGFSWCFANDKWKAADWDLPGAYLDMRESDVLGMLATFKAAAEGHFTPFGPKRNPALGAPDGADWADIPTIEEMPLYLTGVLAGDFQGAWLESGKLAV